MNRIIIYFILISSFYSCSAKIGTTISSKQPPLPDSAFVLVLQQADEFNNDGIEIGTIKSGDNGFSTNCTYYEVIEKLRQKAREAGANVIKIIRHKQPDRISSCDRITAKIYRVPDFRKHEKEIEWSATRKLIWADFKGAPKSISNPGVAAQSYCSFGFQAFSSPFTFIKTKIFVRTVFTCDLSWVRPDQMSRMDLLDHEQGHFDLCEVYARKLRKELKEKKLTTLNLQDANVIYKRIYEEYLDRQESYEKETNYGLDRARQSEWNTTIANELSELNVFSN